MPLFSLVLLLGLLLASCVSPRQLEFRIKAPQLQIDSAEALTDDFYLYQYPLWSPDGEAILLRRNVDSQKKYGPSEFAWEVVVFDLASGDLEVIVGPSKSTYPTWSPDSSEIAMNNFGDQGSSPETEEFGTSHMSIYSRMDGSWRHFPCDLCGWPLWLQDGSILINRNLQDEFDGEQIYGTALMDPRTGEMSNVQPFAGLERLNVVDPPGAGRVSLGRYVVSKDGDRLLFDALTTECSGIWSYRIGGSAPVPFIDSPELAECDPSLSRDETRLVYTTKPYQEPDSTQLVISNADGSSPATFLSTGGYPYTARHPAWSPDGQRIAFVYGLFNPVGPSFSTLYIIDVPPELQP